MHSLFSDKHLTGVFFISFSCFYISLKKTGDVFNIKEPLPSMSRSLEVGFTCDAVKQVGTAHKRHFCQAPAK